MRVLVICDRNSIATKREEFPARLVEVASSHLYFASRASLLQQTYSALCHQSQYGSQYNSITITKIQGFLVRPDNMPRSTHKCLNIYYPSRTYKIISSYELARPIMGTIFLVYSITKILRKIRATTFTENYGKLRVRGMSERCFQ